VFSSEPGYGSMLKNLFVLALMGAVISVVSGCSDSDTTPGIPQGLGDFDRTQKGQSLAIPEKEVTPEDLPYNLGPNPTEKLDVPTSGTFRVKFETTAGDFLVEVHRDWAPVGAQRFYELVEDGFYNDCRFFRVVPGFVVQFGINGTPEKHRKWDRKIPDDKVVQSNRKGTLCFATSGPDTRTTQLFINYGDNSNLDRMGFSVFGEVIEGMHNVEGINPEYGEQPQQPLIERQGNAYLERQFPQMDYIRRATFVSEGGTSEAAKGEPEKTGSGK
jgi:peptidyl-prolyl cis-trans isomerase A (cyclophilin A)